ncbi:MAG: serine protease [Pirellulaceae bacterium]|nr:serine protease [Pirellulaceae bacterium]
MFFDFRQLLPCVLVVSSAVSLQAQVQVDRFEPPIAQRGIDTSIKASGKFTKWPPKVICDRDEVQIVAAKENGQFQVTVPNDAIPGPMWVRAIDEKSASDWVPLLISPVAVTAESEPNNKNSEANGLTMPAVARGKLQKSGDIDTYRVAVNSGEKLIVSVTAHQVLASPMDAVLQLADLDGNVLRQSEDVRGLDPQIVYECKSSEELLIRVFAFPEVPTGTVGFAGAATFAYVLDVTTGPFVDHAFADSSGAARLFGWNLPSEPNVQHRNATSVSPDVVAMDDSLGWSWLPDPRLDSGDQAEPVRHITAGEKITSLPIVAYGHIATEKDVHRFPMIVQKGIKYRIDVRSKAMGFLLDSKLEIVDAKTENELASNDDVTRGQYDAGVDFTAKEDGEVEVLLSDMVDGFGPRHAYELRIGQAKVSYQLELSADHFSVASGESVEIPITVNRDRGFDRKIQITVVGLPEGVSAESVVSEPKGATAKSVPLKLTAKKGDAVQGRIQIVGRELDDDDKPTGQEHLAKFAVRPGLFVRDIWLTKFSP